MRVGDRCYQLALSAGSEAPASQPSLQAGPWLDLAPRPSQGVTDHLPCANTCKTQARRHRGEELPTARSGDISTEESLESLLADGHPAHIKSRIFDQEEHLHHERLIRRFIALWLFVGNLLLLASCVTLAWLLELRDPILLGGATFVVAGSCGQATFLYYRQYRRIRKAELYLRKLHQVRKERLLEDMRIGDGEDLLAIHKRYREEIPEVVDAYRNESNRHRRVHNAFQGITIVGSIATSTLATAAVSLETFDWFTVAVSLVVGISAGFAGYFKYRERSFNLQQTADAIERQSGPLQLGGRRSPRRPA